MICQNILLNFVLICKLCSHKTALSTQHTHTGSCVGNWYCPQLFCENTVNLGKKYKKRTIYVKRKSRRKGKKLCVPSKCEGKLRIMCDQKSTNDI